MTYRKKIWLGIALFFTVGITEKFIPARYELAHGILILAASFIGFVVMIAAAGHYIQTHPVEEIDPDSRDDDWITFSSNEDYKSAFTFDNTLDDIYYNPMYSSLLCNIYHDSFHHDD